MQINLIQYNLVKSGGQSFLTVVAGGTLLPPIDDSHPNFGKILDIVEDPEGYFGEPIDAHDLEELSELFDVSETISKRFEKLSERVSINGGKLFFDGDEIDGTIVETILRFIDEGVEDFKPLVNYIEKIAANPEPHSREQLYDWLRLHDTISITPEGDLIAYKGVSTGGKHPETGEDCYRSGFTGTATVDGTTITGHIPNYVGAEVTMPRSAVAHDPSTACHTGLHVGTHDYARGYANGAMLAVRVNPRDVVSVPTDGGGAKIRVCRYIVEDVIETAFSSVLVAEYSGDSDGTIEGVKADLVIDDEAPRGVRVGDYVEADAFVLSPRYNYSGVVEHVYPSGELTVRRVTSPPDGNTEIAQPGSTFQTHVERVTVKDNPIDAEDTIKIGDRLVDDQGDAGTVIDGTNIWCDSPVNLAVDYDHYGTADLMSTSLSEHNDDPRSSYTFERE